VFITATWATADIRNISVRENVGQARCRLFVSDYVWRFTGMYSSFFFILSHALPRGIRHQLSGCHNIKYLPPPPPSFSSSLFSRFPSLCIFSRVKYNFSFYLQCIILFLYIIASLNNNLYFFFCILYIFYVSSYKNMYNTVILSIFT
jgi:hypothetical protein